MVYGKAVKDVFVVAAKRTPFGALGGKLMKYSATDLMEIAGRAALQSGNINPEIIETVTTGYIYSTFPDAAYQARHAALRLGIPASTPANLVSRSCGTGFQSIISSCQELNSGDAQVALAGGSENMSAVPYLLYGVRFGTKLGVDLKVGADPYGFRLSVLELKQGKEMLTESELVHQLVDYLWQAGIDTHIKSPMGVTAENVAQKYNISRDEADDYAIRSQQRWKKAQDAGVFEDEMAAVTIKTKKGKDVMDSDEHPKPKSTKDTIGKLPTIFKKNGTVTAANASGVADGAGCVILATEGACKAHNLEPLVRIAGYAVVGCDPHIMGIGPVSAITRMLKATELTLEDIDLIEVNEAFASQCLAVQRELGLDPAKTNINGGAIAMGHPVGASGSRIIAHLTHALKRTGNRYAIGSACIGGGQGIAILLENVN